MKRHTWILIVILFAGIVSLINGGEQLLHAVRIAIQEEAESVEQIISDATDKLTMGSNNKENTVSYNIETCELFYIINGEEFRKRINADVSNYWVITVPAYDVRDTSKWTLGALDSKIRELTGGQTGKRMHIKLTERDSTGRTLHVHEAGKAGMGVVCHFEKELGFLTKNRIKAEYTLPYRVVWANVRERASYLGIIALLLGCCWYVTFRYFQMERKNARMRDFYMSLYRHDLRTPINVILGRAYYLKKAGEGRQTDEESKGLETIDIAAKRVGRGIEQLTAMQVCEGKGKENFREVEVNRLLEEVAEREQWYAGAEEAERIHTALQAERATVRGSLAALESVFQNLIENAMKYAGERTEVRVGSTNPKEGWLAVEVADNGQGIAKEEQKRIFKRGYRGKGHKRKPAGTGIGLYMAKLVIKKHGGSISVDSEPGKGCRFSIMLPLKRQKS